MQIEIDCRKCENCDLGNDCCKQYGSDPNVAVQNCASDGFKNYTSK